MQEVCCPYEISLSIITPVADHSQILFSLPVSRLHFLVGRFASILPPALFFSGPPEHARHLLMQTPNILTTGYAALQPLQ